jgi:hypothetical protein
VLAEAASPLPVDALAACFKGPGAGKDVHRLIAVLQRDGQVRRAPDGGYALLRAA